MESDSSQSRSKSKRCHSDLSIRLGIFLIILAVVAVALILLLRGRETITGEFPSIVVNEALTCKKANTAYAKIGALSSKSQEIIVTMIFNETTSLNKISLDYALGYDSSQAVTRADASARAQFNERLGADKFSSTEFDNKFSMLKDKLLVSIYGDSSDLESSTRASYFMLDARKGTPETLEDFRKAYEKQGFKCASTTDE